MIDNWTGLLKSYKKYKFNEDVLMGHTVYKIYDYFVIINLVNQIIE